MAHEKWRKVSEELPSLGEVVLTYASDGSMGQAEFSNNRLDYEPPGTKANGFLFSGGDWDAFFPEPNFSRADWGYCTRSGSEGIRITHWMPWPEPPEKNGP